MRFAWIGLLVALCAETAFGGTMWPGGPYFGSTGWGFPGGSWGITNSSWYVGIEDRFENRYQSLVDQYNTLSQGNSDFVGSQQYEQFIDKFQQFVDRDQSFLDRLQNVGDALQTSINQTNQRIQHDENLLANPPPTTTFPKWHFPSLTSWENAITAQLNQSQTRLTALTTQQTTYQQDYTADTAFNSEIVAYLSSITVSSSAADTQSALGTTAPLLRRARQGCKSRLRLSRQPSGC